MWVLLLNFLNWVMLSKIRYLTKQCKSAKIELDVVLENITQTQLLSQVNCILCWHVMLRQKPCFFAVTANWHKQSWVSWCLNSYQNIFLSLPRIFPISLHFENAFIQKSQEMFGCLWGAKQLILNSRIVWIETSVRKTLPKAQRTRGLSSSWQSNFWGHITSSNTNLDHISSSESRLSIN